MKILHISDTHGQHGRLKDLPEADVIVHSGDFTFGGEVREAIDFFNWFCDLPYAHKIVIAGNHDDCLYDANIEGLDASCHYLRANSVTLEGVKFHGVPMFMADCVTDRQSKHIANIPADTDVLITHCPPLGVLDFDDNIHYGSDELLVKVEQVKPRYHLFGHIHTNNGIEKVGFTTFVNSAIVNAIYDGIQPWHIVEI